MDEKTFKAQFIATFLASWCAAHYDEYCMRDMHGQLEKPPVEDAAFLAGTAWTEVKAKVPVTGW